MERWSLLMRTYASKKAREYADATGMPVLADDSGLVVDVLGGEPGINSARYGGLDAARAVVGVVVGALANGALATLRVQEVSTVSSYSARVLEVADREDGLRASLSGYALSVTR